MLTVILSGPATSRSPTLAMLQRAGANLNEQPEHNPSHGLPDDPDTGWITALVPDLATIEHILPNTDRWQLRLHWITPACQACGGRGAGQGAPTCLHCMGTGATNKPYRPPDPMDEMRQRIGALEQRLQDATPE